MTRRPRQRSSSEAADEGTVLVLMVFFALIIAALITVVVDVSTMFLAQREMAATADGAALDAVQRADVAAIYGGTVGAHLPLSAEQVTTTATAYATTTARIPHECAASYTVVEADLEADGQTVTVQLSCRVSLPFVNMISDLWSDGVTIHETAHARSAVTPLGP
jgi:Flp pilus assembly protein TadG